jgi:hypothetical protein
MRRAVFGAAVCVAIAACGAGLTNEPPREYEPPTRGGPPEIHKDAVPDSLLKKVLADAARRAAAESSKLEVVSTQKVTWSDGALGCPQPDRMYTQALVPGYRIWVRYAEQLFDYHVSENDLFFVCPSAKLEPSDSVSR